MRNVKIIVNNSCKSVTYLLYLNKQLENSMLVKLGITLFTIVALMNHIQPSVQKSGFGIGDNLKQKVERAYEY